MSDQSLMLLLTVSFIVGVTGLFFAFNPMATGFAIFNLSNANATAQANITIVSNVAISVTGGWDFGEGFVNSTGSGAYGDLNSGALGDDPYNYTNWTANVNGTGQVTVQNVGNINITVRANANQSPDRWFCNDENHPTGATHLNNLSLNTTGNGGAFTTTSPCTQTFVSLTNITGTAVNTTTGTSLCGGGNLSVTESVVVDMGVRVDARCPATVSERYLTVTFFGFS